MSTVIEYGDYRIWHAPSPIASMAWHFAHKDFTSEHDGDPRSGNEASEEACRQTIDILEDMEAEDATPEGQARLEAEAARYAEKAMEIVAAFDMARSLHQILSIPGIGNLPGFMTGAHLQCARDALARYVRYHPGLLAQGIEAAKAGETQSGSTEGESPVGNADAPETQDNTLTSYREGEER